MYVPIATNQVTGQYAAMKKAGITINAEAQQRVEKLWDCLRLVHYPDLSLPAIGDATGNLLLIKNADMRSRTATWSVRPPGPGLHQQPGQEGQGAGADIAGHSPTAGGM